MAKHILYKPLITEKTEILSENEDTPKYTFLVNKSANKIEIAKAVEDMFNVRVKSVNTMIMPAKAKSRMTKSGILKGRVSAYKKAIVTLPQGEVIDFYGEV